MPVDVLRWHYSSFNSRVSLGPSYCQSSNYKEPLSKQQWYCGNNETAAFYHNYNNHTNPYECVSFRFPQDSAIVPAQQRGTLTPDLFIKEPLTGLLSIIPTDSINILLHKAKTHRLSWGTDFACILPELKIEKYTFMTNHEDFSFW